MAGIYRRHQERGWHRHQLARQIRRACSKLSRVTDPDAFADASEHTAFGSVDVFILQATDAAHWSWKPFDSDDPDITFTPAQFSPQAFTVFTDLPGNYVLAVRQPQTTS